MNRSRRKNNQIKKSLFVAIEKDNIEQFNNIITNHFTNKNTQEIDRSKFDAIEFNNKSLIGAVIYYDSLGILQELVKNYDVNPTIIDPLISTTPLHYTAILGAKRCIEYLLDYSIDKEIDISNMRDDTGFTPLHWAASSTYDKVGKIIEILLSFGVNIDVRDNQQRTPLHIAILKGSLKTVELLLDSGADPAATEELGSTPLHLAAELGYPTIVDLLLMTNNVNVAAKDFRGLTPLDLATKNNSRDHKIIIFLIIGESQEDNAISGGQLEVAGSDIVDSLINEKSNKETIDVEIIGASDLDIIVKEFEII